MQMSWPRPPAAAVALLAPCWRRALPAWDDDLLVLGNAERSLVMMTGAGAGDTVTSGGSGSGKAFRYSDLARVATTTSGGTNELQACEPEEAEECELFHCVDGCPLTFTTLSSFDEHYSSCHVYRCLSCGLQLPNNRLLDLHVAERHDELFRVMARTRKMYACLVEGCSQKSNTRKGRQLHLVAKHAYPPNFTYDRRVRASATTNGKTGRARRKETPQRRTEADMSDSSFASVASPTSRAAAAAAAAAVAAAPSAVVTPVPAPATSRPPVVSRSTILSFMPRSVARPTATAGAAAGKPVAAAALPSYDPRRAWAPPSVPPSSAGATAPHPVASPHFTTMRDASAMDDDEDGNEPGRAAAAEAQPGAASAAAAAENKLRETILRLPGDEEDQEGDAASAAGVDDMDMQMQSGLSRLSVAPPTLPKKTSFGSLHRRHA